MLVVSYNVNWLKGSIFLGINWLDIEGKVYRLLRMLRGLYCRLLRLGLWYRKAVKRSCEENLLYV